MSRLWKIDVEQTNSATLYVVAANPEEAEDIARSRFKPRDYDWDLFPALSFEEAEAVGVEPSGEFADALVYGGGEDGKNVDLNAVEWWERFGEARRFTPGTPEYQEAVEAAGQTRIAEVKP